MCGGIEYLVYYKKKMKLTSLIMAAGIDSHFRWGIKQLEPVDKNNHIIMITQFIIQLMRALMNEVVFIIWKDMKMNLRKLSETELRMYVQSLM